MQRCSSPMPGARGDHVQSSFQIRQRDYHIDASAKCEATLGHRWPAKTAYRECCKTTCFAPWKPSQKPASVPFQGPFALQCLLYLTKTKSDFNFIFKKYVKTLTRMQARRRGHVRTQLIAGCICFTRVPGCSTRKHKNDPGLSNHETLWKHTLPCTVHTKNYASPDRSGLSWSLECSLFTRLCARANEKHHRVRTRVRTRKYTEVYKNTAKTTDRCPYPVRLLKF